jgi:hypothetical protein
MHAPARADAPGVSAPSCGHAATPGVAESPQCAERAEADERPPDLPSPPSRSRWYGWQTLLADGGSLGLMLAGFGRGTGALGLIGGFGLLLATPVVHLAHGNVLGFLSLGLRVTCAVMMAVGLGGSFDDDETTDTGRTELAAAGLIGLGVTIVLDAALLAFQPRGGIVTPYADAHGGFGLRMAWRL